MTPVASLARIERALPAILDTFGTPCYVYDEQGILERGKELKHAMRHVAGFRQFYAVKAWNNPENLNLQMAMGFGFDCSSMYEMHLVERIGAEGRFILTSNNSREEWFERARELHGIINLDDISLIQKVRNFPGLICFRLNPGKRVRMVGSGLKSFGKPEEQKYGIMWEQLVPAYRMARARGAKGFGIHLMVGSNRLDEEYFIVMLKLLLKACALLEKELGISVEFVDIGGGFGIAYLPTEKDLNMNRIGERFAGLLASFRCHHGYAPKLYTEMGRWMTGPYGVLVTRVINRKEIYHTYVGTDIGMEGLARPAFYNAYHRITVPGVSSRRGYEVVSVVGSICENWDRLATNRRLPRTEEGDVMLVQGAGAHAIVMCSHYNGKTLPPEVMVRMGGRAELIRRGETHDDLDATLNFEPKSVQAY